MFLFCVFCFREEKTLATADLELDLYRNIGLHRVPEQPSAPNIDVMFQWSLRNRGTTFLSMLVNAFAMSYRTLQRHQQKVTKSQREVRSCELT